MCSRSMLVTTAMIGESLRNERSLSSASATKILRLAPAAHSIPSRPRGRRQPQLDQARRLPEPRQPSKWSWSCHACRRWRCHISGASTRPAFRRAGSRNDAAGAPLRLRGCLERIAELVTTTSAPVTFSARWPSKIAAPSDCQTLRDRRPLEIRAGNLVAEIQQAPRQCRSCRCRRCRQNEYVESWQT